MTVKELKAILSDLEDKDIIYTSNQDDPDSAYEASIVSISYCVYEENKKTVISKQVILR